MAVDDCRLAKIVSVGNGRPEHVGSHESDAAGPVRDQNFAFTSTIVSSPSVLQQTRNVAAVIAFVYIGARNRINRK